LTGQGDVESSLPAQLRLMAQLSGWLARRQLEPGQMGPDRVEEFMVASRGEGHRRMCSPRALEPLLGYLRGLGVIPGPVTRPARTPAGQVLEDYRRYLAEQRGLRPRTIAWYEQVTQRLPAGGVAVLTRQGVMGFAERACGGRSTHSAQNVLGALRSFLRFAHVTGVIPQELASAVPTAQQARKPERRTQDTHDQQTTTKINTQPGVSPTRVHPGSTDPLNGDAFPAQREEPAYSPSPPTRRKPCGGWHSARPPVFDIARIEVQEGGQHR